jgi:hypothetical protein
VAERDRQAGEARAGPVRVGPAPRPWWYTRWGSVFLSIDFLLGIPIGAAAGALVAYNAAAAAAATAVLITYVAVDIALAGLALGAITLLASLMSSEYLALLQRVPGGVKGMTRPFKIVAIVSGVAALMSLMLTLAWPAIPATVDTLWRTVRGVTFGLASFTTFWAIIGSVQLVELGTFHMEKRASLVGILQDYRKRQNSQKRA